MSKESVVHSLQTNDSFLGGTLVAGGSGLSVIQIITQLGNMGAMVLNLALIIGGIVLLKQKYKDRNKKNDKDSS